MQEKVTSAQGVTGFLLDSFDKNGNYYFRVYNKEDGTFKDYLVRHCDLEITIKDVDACFYENQDGKMYLDHSPETLGKK